MKGIKLYPTPPQKDFIDRCIEGYRITYNWALSCEQNNFELYNAGLAQYKFLTYYILEDMYMYFRDRTPILQTVPTHSMNNAIKDVIRGYELFFKGVNTRPPKYYKDSSFTSFSSYKPISAVPNFYFEDNYLKIEGIAKYGATKGNFKYGEMIETSYHTHTTKNDKIKYTYPVIFRNNYTGEYTLQYMALKQKLGDTLADVPVSDPIGVDVNRQKLYACSNGIIIPFVDTSREERHLSELDREMLRDRNKYQDQPLSKSQMYKLEKRRKLYVHVGNIHRNNCYNGSLQIIRCNPEAIILETLDLQSMMQKSYVADDLQFHPLGISQRILAEQAFKYDIPVYHAPLNFHSSNICSRCGSYKDIKSNKLFRCDNCGLVLDRDINAAINLKNWYIQNKDNL